MSIKLKKTLYIGLATLMVASTGGASISNISVNAKRRPKTARYLKHHSSRTKHITVHLNKSEQLKSGRYTSIHAPWKRAWNRYAKYTMNSQTWVNSNIFTPKQQVLRHKHENKKNYRSSWNNFFRRHKMNKGSFASSSKISYPQYTRLIAGNVNMLNQIKRRAYGLAFPLNYGHYSSQKYEIQNSEMLANKPLHKFSSHMLNDWHSVAVPAHNSSRVLTSFRHWMKRTHKHPNLNIGNGHKYIFNGRSFVPYKGTNGFKTTYIFNPKKNRYQRVSTKKVVNKVNKDVQNTTQQLDNLKNQQILTIINNPILTAQTKRVCLQAMTGTLESQNTNQNSNNNAKQVSQMQVDPVKTYQAAAKSNQVSPAQQTRLNYMIHSILLKSGIVHQLDPNAKRDILYLDAHGAFQSMTDDKRSALIQKLIYNPNLMNKYLKDLGADASVDITKQPTADANKANSFANKDGSSKTGNGLITNDPTLAQAISTMQRELQQLATHEGINMSQSTTRNQF